MLRACHRVTRTTGWYRTDRGLANDLDDDQVAGLVQKVDSGGRHGLVVQRAMVVVAVRMLADHAIQIRLALDLGCIEDVRALLELPAIQLPFETSSSIDVWFLFGLRTQENGAPSDRYVEIC